MQRLEDIERKLSALEKMHERELGVVQALVARGEAAEVAAQESEAYVKACEEAAVLLVEYSDEKQAEVVSLIQQIASEGLTQVFGEQIDLVIEQTTRAGRIEMDIKVRTGELLTPILEARGGGLAAVAGFILRACVILLTKETRKLLILDEVFAHLSEEYVPAMAEFVRDLCDKTGMQVILVTHQPEFAEVGDRVYRIEKTGPNSSQFTLES